MDFIKKSSLRKIYIFQFLAFLILVLLTTSFLLAYINSKMNNFELEVVSGILADKPIEDYEIIGSISREKTPIELSVARESLEEKGYNNKLITSVKHENIEKEIFFIMFIFLILNLFIYFIFNFIKNKKTLEYIDKVDKFTTSILDRSFDVNLYEYDTSTMSKISNNFNKLASAIKSNYKRLENENDNIRSMLADISHQIKTPISALSINNEIMLQDDSLREDQISFLNVSQKQIARIMWLVSSLLNISKLNANVIKFKNNKFLLQDLSYDFKQLFQDKLDEKNLDLRIVGDIKIEIKKDFEWTKEAVMNIVKNAIEYADNGSDIIISYDDNINMTQISIKNKGPRISEEDLPHIFDRFYKSRHSKKIDSIGIGLNLSRKIIESQDGFINVQNVDNGVIFNVVFIK